MNHSLLVVISASAVVYGTPLSSTQLSATASVPGTFAYSPAAGGAPQPAAIESGSARTATSITARWMTTDRRPGAWRVRRCA